mmetsp:Transcript_42054/g.82720  ORF Transcript_42054/g.82720 Transcript_42054/m.82720 type:complete len:333 (-) Transcript_42054:383-1381(-)
MAIQQGDRANSIGTFTKTNEKKLIRCLCCNITGNAVSLLTAFFLFSTITVLQYFAAIIANSNALKADCISMGVDALSFLGNLVAECMDEDTEGVFRRRRAELIMSGVSHMLLLGFTISFILEAWEDAQATDDEGDAVNGYIVLGFAIGGLVFDVTALASYHYFGTNKNSPEAGEGYIEGESTYAAEAYNDTVKQSVTADGVQVVDNGSAVVKVSDGADELTCGINTNMCAALLHVGSDLLRSTTTLIEGIIIIVVSNRGGDISSTQADGVSTLAVCSIIVIGATAALITWMREVIVFLRMPAHPPPSAAEKNQGTLSESLSNPLLQNDANNF